MHALIPGIAAEQRTSSVAELRRKAREHAEAMALEAQGPSSRTTPPSPPGTYSVVGGVKGTAALPSPSGPTSISSLGGEKEATAALPSPMRPELSAIGARVPSPPGQRGPSALPSPPTQRGPSALPSPPGQRGPSALPSPPGQRGPLALPSSPGQSVSPSGFTDRTTLETADNAQ